MENIIQETLLRSREEKCVLFSIHERLDDTNGRWIHTNIAMQCQRCGLKTTTFRIKITMHAPCASWICSLCTPCMAFIWCKRKILLRGSFACSWQQLNGEHKNYGEIQCERFFLSLSFSFAHRKYKSPKWLFSEIPGKGMHTDRETEWERGRGKKRQRNKISNWKDLHGSFSQAMEIRELWVCK